MVPVHLAWSRQTVNDEKPLFNTRFRIGKFTMKTQRIVFLLLLLGLPLSSFASTPPGLAGQIVKAVSDLKGNFETIVTLQKAVGEVDAGVMPTATDARWSNLAASYDAAAQQIRLLPLPSDFDKQPYSVSGDELSRCSTRAAAVIKLKDFAGAIERGVTDDQALIVKIDEALAQANDARAGVKYLIDANLKLANMPIYGSVFAFNWFDLTNSVSKSLATATDALNSKRKKLVEESVKAKQHASNLRSNIAIFPACSLAGNWRGQCILRKSTENRTFRISQIGPSSYTCARTFTDGSVVPCVAFSFNEVSRQISLSNEQSNGNKRRRWDYSGYVNDQFASMNLQAIAVPIQNSVAAGPLSCTFSRS
jgi:hypothetical protein